MRQLSTIIIAAAGHAVFASFALADMPFAVLEAFAPQDGASSVAAGDLDRDGQMDLVMTSIEGDEVWIRFADFATGYQRLASGYDRACYVVIADINGDSWPDVVAAKRGTGDDDVRWWENPGSPGVWAEHPVSGTLFDEARSIATGDLDEDGDVDILVAGVDSGTGYLSWFENTSGAGTIWALHDIVAGFAGAHDIAVADINGDGLPDVVGAAYDDDTVAWFENDGTIHSPGYWPAHSIATDLDGAICVNAADLDSDGDVDVVAGAYIADRIVWYANDGGSGTSWIPEQISAIANGVYTVTPVDLDADGDLDVLAASRDNDRITWHERNGALWQGWIIDSTFDGARSAVAADFDSDGDLDVIAAAEFADRVGWWENLSIHRSAAFPSTEELSDTSIWVETVTAADIDRDGDLDVVDTRRNDSATDPDIVVWLQGSPGWTPVAVVNDLEGVTMIRVADLNGDGAPDLVAPGCYSLDMRWYENTGSGTFTEHLIPDPYDVASLDVADIDCDGDLDLVTSERYESFLSWWENDLGDGLSWTEHQVTPPFDPSQVRAGDVDGDCAPDLVAGVLGSTIGEVWLLTNEVCSGGGWSSSFIGPMGMANLALGDFDQDGRTDIATAGLLADDASGVWLNHSPWEWHQLVSGGDHMYDLRAADLDLDGDLDLVTASLHDDEVRLWENDGTGTTWTGTLLDSFAYPKGLDVGDIDRDGDPDILCGSWGLDFINLYSNRGGQFRMEPWDVAPAAAAEGRRVAVFGFTITSFGRGDDPDSELRLASLRITDGTTAFTQEQATANFESVEVWHDADDSGVFCRDGDVELYESSPVVTGSGILDLFIDPGGPNPRIAGAGGAETYWAVLKLTDDALDHPPNTFRVTFVPASATGVAYADDPSIYLRGEWRGPMNGSVVTMVEGPFFADDFESGDTTAWSTTVP